MSKRKYGKYFETVIKWKYSEYSVFRERWKTLKKICPFPRLSLPYGGGFALQIPSSSFLPSDLAEIPLIIASLSFIRGNYGFLCPYWSLGCIEVRFFIFDFHLAFPHKPLMIQGLRVLLSHQIFGLSTVLMFWWS